MLNAEKICKKKTKNSKTKARIRNITKGEFTVKWFINKTTGFLFSVELIK